MRRLTAIAVTLGVLVVVAGQTAATPAPRGAARGAASGPATIPADALNDVVKRYCQRCHNDTQRRGNLTLAPAMLAPKIALSRR